MARGWHGVAETGEGLVDWCGLDDALVRELLVRGWCNGEPGRGTFPAGSVGRLHGSSEGVHVAVAGCLIVLVASLALLLAGFNDLSLSLPHINTPLKLLTHGGVLGMEAGGQARKADVLDGGTVLGAHGPGRPSGEGAGRVDNGGVAREVEASWAMARGGHVGRRGLLLDDYLGAMGTTGSGDRLAVR